ncbi:MAG: hypothetical protein JNL32_12920 [Candidatus Kapabacteria bacterium]|nr:hypothetical protein [Candidatus Kapabacteria bacterium]
MNNRYDHPYNFSEQLQRYADGDLPPHEQAALFDAMKETPALQDELRSMMKMNSMLQSTKDVAPPALRSSVLNAVAALSTPPVVSAPVAALAGMAAAVRTTSVAPWMAALAGVAVGTAFTWFVLSGWNSDNRMADEIASIKRTLQEKQQDNQNQSRGAETESIRAMTNSYNARIAGLEEQSRGLSQQNIRLSGALRDMARLANEQRETLQQQSAEREQLGNAVTHNANTFAAMQDGIRPVPVMMESVRYVRQHEIREIPVILSQQQPATANVSVPSGFTLDVRSYGMQSFPTVNVASLVSPPLNNIALGLRKNLTSEHSVGVELGQENVLQRYTTEQGGTLVSIDQNYLALWGGLAYQYTPQSSFGQDFVLPYARGVVGGTAMGPLFRGQAGLAFPIMDGLRVALAAEAAAFMYRQNSAWFSTNKIGWTLGFGFGF